MDIIFALIGAGLAGFIGYVVGLNRGYGLCIKDMQAFQDAYNSITRQMRGQGDIEAIKEDKET